MKEILAVVLLSIILFPVFSQEPPVPQPVTNPAPDATEDAMRLNTIRYGTETEIAALIQTLKTENTGVLDAELITAAKNTRNRNILSGVFSFFGDRNKEGLEDRALRAIEERDDEANETVLAALAYLGKIKFISAVPYIGELLDSEEQQFTSACIKALGLIGGSMPAGNPKINSDTGSSNTDDSSITDTEPPAENGPEFEPGETIGPEEDSFEDDSEPLQPDVRKKRKLRENAAAVAEYLIEFYNNRSPGDENRREIITALGDVGSPAGVSLLREIAENNDERAVLRMSALDSLAKIGDKGGLNAILLSVESADPNVRSSAVAALGPFSGADVDNAILEAFRDSYYKTRMAAARAARDRRFVKAVPYLRYRAERDDVPAVKDEAVKALGAIGNSESLDILSSLFTERKNADQVRLLSAEMLLQNNADAYAAKVIAELDEAKRKNQTPLYNGFLRVLGPVKAPVLEDLARRFFFSGGVVEKSYALDMVLNNRFSSLAEQVRELRDEKNGSLSRKSKLVAEQLGL
ncbi:MAG: HEAT repeat domain-containing protein [Treponema sp.]|nr:HEAT repeat domain-containing protein [Treponema sp.]